MPKPSAYKHLAAWCRLHSINGHHVLTRQRWANEDNAPIDAVYHGPNGWVTIAQCGKRTQMAIEVELNRGAKP